jgi:hypothetical protein
MNWIRYRFGPSLLMLAIAAHIPETGYSCFDVPSPLTSGLSLASFSATAAPVLNHQQIAESKPGDEYL